MFRRLSLLGFVIFSVSATVLPAQDMLPALILHRCDSILTAELGKELFETCVALREFEEVKFNHPGRQDYRLAYTLTFPAGDTLELPFVCAIYNGELHIQSGLFLRNDHSDLPPGFAEKGIDIITRTQAIESACRSDSLLAAKRSQLKAQLMLTQDSLWWSVGFYQYVPNPEGDAEEWVWRGYEKLCIGKRGWRGSLIGAANI